MIMDYKQHNIAVLFIALLITIGMVSCSSAGSLVNMDSDGIALKGYDTVAYFTEGKPVKGNKQFSHDWKGAKWLFANKQHLDLFASSPEKYAPQYGGY
jgi:YHS domain-containing protein